MANLKEVKLLNESKSKIEKDIITEIKMLEEDDDLNANYNLKGINTRTFSRIEAINEKIREICTKASLNTEECGFDKQMCESV